jgi:hypothetical protein
MVRAFLLAAIAVAAAVMVGIVLSHEAERW